MKENTGVWIVLIIVATSAVFIFTPLAFSGFFAYQAGTEANLTVWDSTEPKGGSVKVYADGSWKGTTLAKFFANYTNITSGESVNGSGVGCNISFNLSTGWTSPAVMWFNDSSLLYESNYTFDSRGFYKWNVTCDGSSQGYDVLSVTDDNVTIRNTPPYIDDLDPETCYEDAMCIYNFSADCHDIDDIDENNLTYGYVAGTEFTGFNIDPDTGNTTVYVTTDNDCGEFTVSIAVQDATGSGAVANKSFTVNAVNDKPVLGSVPASSNQNSSLYYDIDATDEESSEFYFNITFLSCYRPFNEQHTNLTECSALFVINNTSGVINRTDNFNNSEVGNYTINFTVTDPGDNATSVPPYTWLENKTDWLVTNFSVIDLNDRPSIDPVSDQFWAQNENRKLVINASDIDNGTLVFSATTLYRNLSVYYNSSLFPITLNETAYLDNGTILGNGTMDFSPVQNSQVGNYTVNISVYDGRVNGTHSILVDFTVLNVNDPPNLSFVCKNYSVQGLEYVCDAGENTTDPDDFPSYVPYSDPVNGTLTFKINFTYCNKTFNESDTNCSIFGINQTTGVINYTNPLRKDSGNYTLNISAEDGGNLVDWQEFNLTVIPDYRPNITTSVPPQSATQNQSFFLSVNATDLDNGNDNLTFRTETYYNSVILNNTLFPIQTDTTFWVSDNITMGIMNYTTVNNSQVGNYSVKIIVNDTWGREDYILVNFTVYNLNDLPVMNFSCANSTYEDNEYACNVGENTTDLDSETPYGETLTYNLTFISGSPLFDINSTTGMINFTATNNSWANDTYNFTYVLNITVTDSNGSVDWQEFNLTIHAVNDPPQFNFTNRTAWENSTFFMDLGLNTTDEENDTPFFYNLTFVSCSRVSGTNCSIIAINNATGVVNRTNVFESGEVGNYTINVTVTDSGNTTEPQNATGWQLIEFKVLPINYPPSADIVGAIPSNVIDENETVILAINVTDPDGDDVTCTWFMNTTEIGNVNECQDYNSWGYTASFEDSGDWIFRVEATDSLLTDSDQWDVIIINENRPPELVFSVPPQEWAANNPRSMYPNLSYYVRDPDNRNNVSNDDNNLTITYTTPPHMVSVMIDGQSSPVNVSSNWTGNVMFIPQTDWYGTDYIFFTVNDSEYNVTTNNITLNVSYSEIGVETIIRQTEGGGYAISETKIAVLTITVSSLKRMSSNDQTYVTVTLKNTGEVMLNNINILPFVKESDEISLALSRRDVSQLGIGNSVDSNLTITTHDLTKDEYEIKITGSVTNPRFNQSTSIYLRPLYNRTKLEERIQMTKDLFQDNPECLDLTELIFEAERELDQDNLGKAKDLTETALDNCRDIIRYTNATRRKVTPGLESIPVNEIMIGLLSIALLSILVYLWLGSRAEAKRVTGRKG